MIDPGSLTGGGEVEANRSGAASTRHGALRREGTASSSDELEELDLEEAKGEPCFLAVSGIRKIRFGEGEPREDLLWIRRMNLKAISA